MKEKLLHLLKNPLRVFIWFIIKLPYFRFIYDLKDTEEPVNFAIWYKQKVKGFNKQAYWPMDFTSKVVGVRNIYIGIGTNPGINPGCYIQGSGKLYFGNYCIFGPNVGILSGNHDLYDNRKYSTNLVTKLGDYCWVGMNAVILPGVELGDFTIVAAGSVVTKSFPDGYCVIGGNPAKNIKSLEPEKCIRYKNKHEYHGYIRKDKFEKYRKKKLMV
jgi:acetyltransferase-like isoleucine patch superfamily enzyme